MPRKTPTAKPPKKAKKAPANPLEGLDPEMLAQLRDMLREQLLGGESEDPLEMFEDLLELAQNPKQAEEAPDFLEDVVAMLSQVVIDDNGGDPEARDLRAAIVDRLDEALSDEHFDPAGLVMIAKVLSDTGLGVPDRLKERVVESLEAAPETGGFDLAGALDEIAEAAGEDAFVAYDALNSVLAAFPSDAAARMVSTLGVSRAPVLMHTLAGFAMHRDARLAGAAIEELRRLAAGGSVESALVERLVRMRPWLPLERQGALDEAIRALRSQALAPVELEKPKTAKCFVMACDGSGAGGALASLKAADGWRFVSAMTKATGVEDVLSLENLAKREVDATVRGMRENVSAAETDVQGLARYLQLALGENVSARRPPPFKLIAFVESLGLGPLAPRVISPADLLAEMIDELPPGLKGASALKLAHEASVGGVLSQPWFEAGEEVERLIGPVRGPKARVKALMTAYLPQRRDYWTRVIALTAFALALDRKTYGLMGANLALIGRELASGTPLEQIPLMREIAQATVAAYQSRM